MSPTCAMGHTMPPERAVCPTCGMGRLPAKQEPVEAGVEPVTVPLDLHQWAGQATTSMAASQEAMSGPATPQVGGLRGRAGLRRRIAVAAGLAVLVSAWTAYAVNRGARHHEAASASSTTGSDQGVAACTAKTLYLAHAFQAYRNGTITKDQADQDQQHADQMPHPGVSDNQIFPWATTISTYDDQSTWPAQARQKCDSALHPYVPGPAVTNVPQPYKAASGSCKSVMEHLYDSMYHGDFGTGADALAAAQATLGDNAGRKQALADANAQELNIPDGIAFLDHYCDASEK